MNSVDTLLLTRSEVARILKIEECMGAVEELQKYWVFMPRMAPITSKQV